MRSRVAKPRVAPIDMEHSAHRGRGTLLSRWFVRYGAAIRVEEAMTYYAVSQPDGRGFPPHDDLIYGVGKTIRPTQEPSDPPRISAGGKTYALPHYCSRMGRYPAAYLTAGNVATCIEVQQWPCRLFEVEGDPITGSFVPAPEEWHRAMDAHRAMVASRIDAARAANRQFGVDVTDDRYRRQHEEHEAARRERRYRRDNLLAERYGGFRELTIVRELEPAHQVFGPFGADVVRLIERSKKLNARELERLAVAQRCPYPDSASTYSVDQPEAGWWATKSLAVSDVIEEAAYEAGRRGAKQSACKRDRDRSQRESLASEAAPPFPRARARGLSRRRKGPRDEGCPRRGMLRIPLPPVARSHRPAG